MMAGILRNNLNSIEAENGQKLSDALNNMLQQDGCKYLYHISLVCFVGKDRKRLFTSYRAVSDTTSLDRYYMYRVCNGD